MRSFSPGSTSTYRSLGMESSLTFPLLGTTCTSMMVSVRLPISSSSGLVSTPSTSTLSGPSVISSSPNILSTQLLGEASTSSGSGWDAWVSVIKERGPAKSSKPKTKATSMTGNDHIHQRMRRGFRRSLVYPWKSLIHGKSSTLATPACQHGGYAASSARFGPTALACQHVAALWASTCQEVVWGPIGKLGIEGFSWLRFLVCVRVRPQLDWLTSGSRRLERADKAPARRRADQAEAQPELARRR